MPVDAIVGGTLLTGAAIGLVAAFWSKLKSLAWRVVALFVVRFVLENDAGVAVAEYLWRHGKRSRYGERAYDSAGLFVQPVDRQLVVGFEKIGNDPAVFWVGRVPVLASFVGQGPNGTYGLKLTVTFLRGTMAADGLVERAVDELNARRHGDGRRRFTIQRVVGRAGRRPPRGGPPGGDRSGDEPMTASGGSSPSGTIGDESAGRRYLKWAESELGPPAPPDPLGPLAFPPAIDDLVTEARRWLASEKWYKEKQMPWRRGWLFYGPPGTGKTSLARAICVALDIKLIVLELGTLDDGELIRAWHDARNSTPCMVLIEDIDNVFHLRENVMGEQGPGLNFGTLLNCVGGVEGADGILLVVSTNKIELIDPALGVPDATGKSTRPGRIDRAVELTYLDEACRKRVAARILADCPDAVPGAVAAGDGMTGAQFQEHCGAIALDRHWADMGTPPAPVPPEPVTHNPAETCP